MKVFVITNAIEIMKNVDVNVKDSLTKDYVIQDLFGILLVVNVNVANHVT